MTSFYEVTKVLRGEKYDLYVTPINNKKGYTASNFDAFADKRHGCFRTPDGVLYDGYYEIKTSPLGPIMIKVKRGRCKMQGISVEMKVADNGWHLYQTDWGPGHIGHCYDIYDLIDASNRIPSNMSVRQAQNRWRHFSDHPKPQEEMTKADVQAFFAKWGPLFDLLQHGGR